MNTAQIMLYKTTEISLKPRCAYTVRTDSTNKDNRKVKLPLPCSELTPTEAVCLTRPI